MLSHPTSRTITMLRLLTSLRPLGLSLALFAAAAVQAAPVAPAVRAEIDALFQQLQTSGCEFNRNGSWHSATEAQAHLLKKLDYLEGKDAVKTTEQFIERGASTSSLSGKPYLVRCGARPPVNSGPWLMAELKALRARSTKP